MGPSTPGPSVLIADLPSLTHLAACARRPRPAPANGSGVTVVVHILPEAVLNAPAFAEWVGGFGPGTTHLFACAALFDGASVFRSSAIMARHRATAPPPHRYHITPGLVSKICRSSL